MQKRLETDQYFTQEAITQRIKRRLRRNQIFMLHILLSLVPALLAGYILVSHLRFRAMDYPQIGGTVYTRELEAGVILLGLAFLLLIHYFWKRSHERADAEIDAEMREARHYQQRGDVFDHDTVYRLSDDGELFYDEEEIEYDVKAKRKHGG